MDSENRPKRLFPPRAGTPMLEGANQLQGWGRGVGGGWMLRVQVWCKAGSGCGAQSGVVGVPSRATGSHHTTNRTHASSDDDRDIMPRHLPRTPGSRPG
ncbi:hypothetical protein F751_0066 [Auxenochlorella protothecoides]|uniref:Uncharacterized protein n=1 Tax=Auxenochlorella protothecoides TaxID=3075 RepID=A0A087S9I8_AUXPR|nr:hypothetical protein F751_0066 [Auxenochlorella protothecoides]KFM22392.1 hypothetical protein F751_0066 [Auxenochlorella protothecoides]